MIACIYLLAVIIALSWSLEPECPFDSPLVYLADLDGRCDRYWECNGGIMTEFYCSMGSGFDALAHKCHKSAACLKTEPHEDPFKATDDESPVIKIQTSKSIEVPIPSLEKIVKVGAKLLSPLLSLFTG